MSLILPIHILAGGVALACGYTALYAAKGGRLHRKSGMLFVCAMCAMCVGGFVLAALGNNNWTSVNASAAVMTLYLVITSLTTIRPPASGARWLAVGAMLVAFVVGAANLNFGFEALATGGRRNGVPAFPFFMFGLVGLLGSAGDLRMIRSAAQSGRPRLLRHLWRMSFALFIAAMSFFFGQAKVIPEPLRIMPLLVVPVLAVLLTMIYWVWRARVGRRLLDLVSAGPRQAAALVVPPAPR
jgi:uncharacterized membrane protein